MKKPIMKLQDVSKIYYIGEEKFYALNKVNLEIYEGEFSSILGPSGSGKSTLLHMLGLLDEPSEGKIYLDGIEVHKLNEEQRAILRGKKIGFIFQMFNLIPSLTVLENAIIPAIIYEKDRKEAEKKAIEILNSIGMGSKLYNYPNQISGGQQQRVAIARALINDPKIILADEPTGNLDTKTGKEVLNLFQKLHEQGRTIIIVTHDEGITKLTKRTIKIMDGKIIKS
jgi:putative ABC transport system ATP-binding protein